MHDRHPCQPSPLRYRAGKEPKAPGIAFILLVVGIVIVVGYFLPALKIFP